jgi:hypothetical protein
VSSGSSVSAWAASQELPERAAAFAGAKFASGTASSLGFLVLPRLGGASLLVVLVSSVVLCGAAYFVLERRGEGGGSGAMGNGTGGVEDDEL